MPEDWPPPPVYDPSAFETTSEMLKRLRPKKRWSLKCTVVIMLPSLTEEESKVDLGSYDFRWKWQAKRLSREYSLMNTAPGFVIYSCKIVDLWEGKV